MSNKRYVYSNTKKARYDKKTNSYEMLTQGFVPRWARMPDQEKNSVNENLKLLESIAELNREGKAPKYNNKQQRTTLDTSMG